MVSDHTKEVFILGLTYEGRTFRPSDWAERLAGVMSQFRPGGATPDSYISYSPWCVPNSLDGNKCVIVHTDLREEEPMAWNFVMNFAKDNDLQVLEACLLPDPPVKEKALSNKKPATAGFCFFALLTAHPLQTAA